MMTERYKKQWGKWIKYVDSGYSVSGMYSANEELRYLVSLALTCAKWMSKTPGNENAICAFNKFKCEECLVGKELGQCYDRNSLYESWQLCLLYGDTKGAESVRDDIVNNLLRMYEEEYRRVCFFSGIVRGIGEYINE